MNYSFSSKSLFSSKIVCADCGGLYGKKVWHSNTQNRKVIWQCNDKFKNEKKCTTPTISENQIKNLFVKAYNTLTKNKKSLIEDCKIMIETITNTAEVND